MNVERHLIEAFRIDCPTKSCPGDITLSVERVREILDAPDEPDEYRFDCPGCSGTIRPKITKMGGMHDAEQLVVWITG